MNISAQSCASQPPQTPGDHRLCYTGQPMHSQPGKRLKSYHQTPTGTGRHPRPNRHHTFSLPAGTVYIQPWWSMTSMSQSLWTELSTVFRKVFFELSDNYKTLAMPNVIIERQPRRQNYFLELDDLLLCDYIVDFRNSNMPPLKRHYSSQMTLTDPAVLAGLQHQSDLVAGYNRLKRTDYCALAQVIVHSDIACLLYTSPSPRDS